MDYTLRRLVVADAPELLRVLEANRSHLDRWLRWSGAITTLSETISFVKDLTEKPGAFHEGIWCADALAGGAICWGIEPASRCAEVGYWLSADRTGHGVATGAVASVIRGLFEQSGVNRIEMQCAVDNVRSRALPERLGFQFEGIRRESHRIANQFVDHAVYSLLAREYSQRG